MDRITGARMGSAPLPYVGVVLLLPLWIFSSIGDNSLLYSLSVVLTTLLKASLLSCWIFSKPMPFPPRFLLLVAVVVLETVVLLEDLQISLLPLVVLVPLSTITGVAIILFHTESREGGPGDSQVIGIFSRCSEDEYNWLTGALRSAGKVVPFYISNSNVSEFRRQVSRCTFAILYHSKTRGRLNITDVTDSLYDEEVAFMAKELGREKVVVVVDDLEDSSEGVKQGILQSQRTIYNCAQDLLLFTRGEKQDKERTRQILQPILSTLNPGSSNQLIVDLIPALILAAPWIHYICNSYHGVALILSNVGGSLLLGNFLLPFGSGSAGAGFPALPALLVVTALELVAAFWYYSKVKAILLAVQSVAALLYALISSSSSSSLLNSEADEELSLSLV